jgi:hypothetical protein
MTVERIERPRKTVEPPQPTVPLREVENIRTNGSPAWQFLQTRRGGAYATGGTFSGGIRKRPGKSFLENPAAAWLQYTHRFVKKKSQVIDAGEAIACQQCV